ncbi:hypothetical protein IG206_02095 [Candidatus Parvarchaeota archaeon]|nr:hypothetical protein [Candidatus Acidifodinimicrobium mancum]
MDLNDLINRVGIKPTNKRNGALDTYIEDSNQKREKLETLLSEFLRITSDKSAPVLIAGAGIPVSIAGRVDYSIEYFDEYYSYIYKNINNLDFNIPDVAQLTGNEKLYNIGSNDKTNLKFGLFLSALINKNIKRGEKIQIITSIPIHCLFYKLGDAEAYVNIAGDYLGYESKNSKVYTDEVGENAGSFMKGCELYVKKAGSDLGSDAKNSKIYAEEARNDAGYNMQNCELHVKKAGYRLGDGAKNSKIYAEEAEDYTGFRIRDCELHVKKASISLGFYAKNSKIYADKAGDYAGNSMRDGELHIKKAGDWLGHDAKNSKIYADEAGIDAGVNMENSQLFVYNGNLDDSCLRGNNKIYLGGESYKEFIQNYPKYINKVKLWEKKS